jgi:hypothetical protein
VAAPRGNNVRADRSRYGRTRRGRTKKPAGRRRKRHPHRFGSGSPIRSRLGSRQHRIHSNVAGLSPSHSSSASSADLPVALDLSMYNRRRTLHAIPLAPEFQAVLHIHRFRRALHGLTAARGLPLHGALPHRTQSLGSRKPTPATRPISSGATATAPGKLPAKMPWSRNLPIEHLRYNGLIPSRLKSLRPTSPDNGRSILSTDG